MISNKYIKSLDFKTLEDIFLYIIDSEINGNYGQCKELLKKLSNEQFVTFSNWFNNNDLINSCERDLNDFVAWRIE